MPMRPSFRKLSKVSKTILAGTGFSVGEALTLKFSFQLSQLQQSYAMMMIMMVFDWLILKQNLH